MKMRRILALSLALFVTACGLIPDMRDETANMTAEQILQAGREASKAGDYTKAVKFFDSLESRFPYGVPAQQAILENAYANYKAGETAAAVAAADRFIKLYPNHRNVDYAYYLRGLASFNEDLGLFSKLGQQDLAERDPKLMKESYQTFKELVAKFPDSRYAEDSRARMRFLVASLASGETYVARYYFNRNAYVAAATRAQQVLLTYPNTPANEEALWIMVRSYDRLGLSQLRDDARRILEQTFPQSPYLAEGASKPWWRFW